MNSYKNEILRATSEAARFRAKYPLGDRTSFDILGLLESMEIPVLFRPLDGLWGAAVEIGENRKGILITSKLDLSIQRFTLAHELGHLILGHSLSFDKSLEDNDHNEKPNFLQENAANAFASELLISKSYIKNIFAKQGWDRNKICDPLTVYQLGLRLGVSYRAICSGIQALKLLDADKIKFLASYKLKVIKSTLLSGIILENAWGNVWDLSEKDSDTLLETGSDDLFILHLKENFTGGYCWEFEKNLDAVIKIISDQEKIVNHDESKPNRIIKFYIPTEGIHKIHLVLRKKRSKETVSSIQININNYGKEKDGLSRRTKTKNLSHL